LLFGFLVAFLVLVRALFVPTPILVPHPFIPVTRSTKLRPISLIGGFLSQKQFPARITIFLVLVPHVIAVPVISPSIAPLAILIEPAIIQLTLAKVVAFVDFGSTSWSIFIAIFMISKIGIAILDSKPITIIAVQPDMPWQNTASNPAIPTQVIVITGINMKIDPGRRVVVIVIVVVIVTAIAYGRGITRRPGSAGHDGTARDRHARNNDQ